MSSNSLEIKGASINNVAATSYEPVRVFQAYIHVLSSKPSMLLLHSLKNVDNDISALISAFVN